MKRVIALFFIILLCFTITGCGKQQEYTDYTQYLTPSASENGTNGGQSPVQSAQFVGADADQLPQGQQIAGGQGGSQSAATGQGQANGQVQATSAPVYTAPPTAAGTGSGTPQDAASSDFANVVTIVATPAPVVTQAPMPVITPTPTPFAIQTPAPTPVPNQIRITKSPISETLQEGGSCYFTAYADNSQGITWITVSPDAKNSYLIGDAVKLFPGLNVSGQGTNTLSLANVPYAMNGWRIQAYFSGNGGPQYTAGAYLTVLPGMPVWPTAAPTYKPVDPAESNVAEMAKKAYSDVYYTASANGFSVGNIVNYIYNNGVADFNITVSNYRYQIIGEFNAYCYAAGNSGYGPAHVMVYDNYGNLQASVNLSGQGMSAYFALLSGYLY